MRENGYLPLSVNVELSKTNPFYLNNVRLLELRSPISMGISLTSIEENTIDITPNKSATSAIGKSASGGYLSIFRTDNGISILPITQSGAIYLRATNTGVP